MFYPDRFYDNEIFQPQFDEFHLLVRTDDLEYFVLKVEVPDHQNDTCFFRGVDSHNTTLTADIHLCRPQVVRFQINL